MTMPHLMNCQHMGDGWCLDCVKREWDATDARISALEAELAKAKAAAKPTEADAKLKIILWVLTDRMPDFSSGWPEAAQKNWMEMFVKLLSMAEEAMVDRGMERMGFLPLPDPAAVARQVGAEGVGT